MADGVTLTKSAILPNKGKGEELRQILMRELGIPYSCRWFEVRFALGEVVSVKCEYMPMVEQEKSDG